MDIEDVAREVRQYPWSEFLHVAGEDDNVHRVLQHCVQYGLVQVIWVGIRLIAEVVPGDPLLFGTSKSARSTVVTDDDGWKRLQSARHAGIDDRLHVAAIM